MTQLEGCWRHSIGDTMVLSGSQKFRRYYDRGTTIEQQSDDKRIAARFWPWQLNRNRDNYG